MSGYDGGYRRGPSWADPYGGAPRGARRHSPADRPWVGGYREGYQGGSGGYPVANPGAGGYGGDFAASRPARYGRDFGRTPRYGGDYWWIGERAYPQGASYDDAYREFDRQHHPRYSPVGGMYHAMGGEYRYRRPPSPLRDGHWFSDWTRWF